MPTPQRRLARMRKSFERNRSVLTADYKYFTTLTSRRNLVASQGHQNVSHPDKHDFFQTTQPDLLFRDVSLYTETITSPEQAPGVFHQAIATAYAGRGVAHLTLPQDVIVAKAEGEFSSVATLKPRQEFAASDEDIAEITRWIDDADSVVIMCGGGCRGAADQLRALGPAHGPADPFCQGQRHHAIR